MSTLLKISSNSNSIASLEELEFINGVGAIFAGSVVISRHSTHNPIRLSSIRRTQVVKKRRYLYRFLFGALAIVAFSLPFTGNLNRFQTAFLLVAAFSFASVSAFANNAEYKLVVFMSLDYFEVAVPADLKSDAKAISRYINRKIKKVKYR